MIILNSAESYIKISESIKYLKYGQIKIQDNTIYLVDLPFKSNYEGYLVDIFIAKYVPAIIDLYQGFELFGKNNECRTCGKTAFINVSDKVETLIYNFFEEQGDAH